MFNTIINLIHITLVALLLALTLFIYGSGKAAAAEGGQDLVPDWHSFQWVPQIMENNFPVAGSLISGP